MRDHASSPGAVPTAPQSAFPLVPNIQADHIPGAEVNSAHPSLPVPAVPSNPYATAARPLLQPFFREPAHQGTTEEGRKRSMQRASSRSSDPLGLPNSGTSTKPSKKAVKSKNERAKATRARTPEEDEKATVTVTVLLFPLPVSCLFFIPRFVNSRMFPRSTTSPNRLSRA
jgi:hypothetical protein